MPGHPMRVYDACLTATSTCHAMTLPALAMLARILHKHLCGQHLVALVTDPMYGFAYFFPLRDCGPSTHGDVPEPEESSGFLSLWE
jgi:hypothetical protein